MSNITPRIDIAFKKIFGVEENKDLLIVLINSIVGEEDQVVDVTLLNPYNHKNFKNDKLSILDIKAVGHNNKRFNIELQITNDADYEERALYYWAKLYTEQLKAGGGYRSLSKAIGIHILNFNSVPVEKKYHNVFHITEKETGIKYFKHLELHTIELQKFTQGASEELSDIVAKITNALDIWVAFLTRHDLMNADNLPIELDNPSLRKALNVLEVMNLTAEERDAYDGRFKWLWIEESALRKAREDGLEEGREVGREVGREEGREEGREKERKEMINSMLARGKQLQEISEFTGICLEELYKITMWDKDGVNTGQIQAIEQEKEAV
jgi:predicted transposase/invertase (TIGR01784 family)